MPLITTPGPDCESLCSVDDANTYHELRGNIARWSPLENTRKEQLLRLGYEWLYGRYWARWPAGEVFGTAAGVPDIVMRGARDACALLALYALDGPLDPEPTPQVLEQDVGPIKTKYAQVEGGRQFPDVARLMAPYLVKSNPYSIPLRRA
jgi:hypothetical protein